MRTIFSSRHGHRPASLLGKGGRIGSKANMACVWGHESARSFHQVPMLDKAIGFDLQMDRAIGWVLCSDAVVSGATG